MTLQSIASRRVDFMQSTHAATQRDYVGRVLENDKAACAEVAGRFDREYWDGDRHFGYGGYRYDGRWKSLAERLVRHYSLRPGDKVLDIGCGKAYLLYELAVLVPGLEVSGIDISAYALEHAKPEIQSRLTLGDAKHLPYESRTFDLVISLATLHNLALPDLWRALGELERVANGPRKYVMVESYRNEQEKVNLLYWQLTCKSFFSVGDWEWLYRQADYRGEFDFIFFT